MWPFSKKTESEANDIASEAVDIAPTVEAPIEAEPDHGPFDGDAHPIEQFDFSDFSDGFLDLGSIKIPLPRPSEVQVEMGPEGPRMVHVVTQVGRVTPVAFASSMSGGLWEESVTEILEGMRADGLDADLETGPWGPEVVGKTEHATIRMIGAEGNRWTLRLTLAAPNESAADMAALGREIMSRTFVYRGENPMMAGSVLPVVLPAQLVEQVQQAMREREAQLQAENEAQVPAVPEAEQVAPTQDVVNAEPDEGTALQQMQARAEENEAR